MRVNGSKGCRPRAGAGLALCAASAMLATGGCTKKVGGQVVAVVNNQEITQGEVNAELGGRQIPPGADRRAVMGQLVQQIVDRKLLAGKARDQGLDKSPVYLAQVQRAQDTVLINLLASNAAKAAPVPDAAAAQRFMADNPSLFAGRKRYALDQLVFAAKPDAGLEAKLRPAKTMAEVEAVLTGAGVRFQRTSTQMDTAALPPPVAAKIASLPPGEPFVVPQNGQVIVNVIRSAEPVPMPAGQAGPAAVELLRRQTVEQAMRKQVEQARGAATITYSPDVAPPKAGAAAKPS